MYLMYQYIKSGYFDKTDLQFIFVNKNLRLVVKTMKSMTIYITLYILFSIIFRFYSFTWLFRNIYEW